MNALPKNNQHLLNPDLVRHDLKKNRRLWTASYYTFEGLLFDGMPEFTEPTVFYLIGREKRDPKLLQLAAAWQPDLIAWLSEKEKFELMERNEDMPDWGENEILMIAWEFLG